MVIVCVRLSLLVPLLFTVFAGDAQSRFTAYLNAAFDSSEKNLHVAALTLLYKAQALKGVDTGYNESVNLYIGSNYLAIGKIDSGISYFDNSIKYYEEQQDSAMLNYIYSRMGRVEIEFTRRYDKALTYFKRQIPYSVSQQDSTSFFHCLINTGIAYKYLKQYDSALYYFRIVEANHSIENVARNIALRSAADIYSLLQQYDKALSYYDRAIRTPKSMDDSINLFITFLNKGDCLMQQGRFPESLACFKQAEQFSTGGVTDNDKKILFENLAYVFSKTGDFQKAFYYKNLEVVIKDSINTHSIEQAAAEMESKYEVRKNKDSLNISTQNLKLANNESEDRQRKFIISLISAAAISLLLFLALRNAAIRKKANNILAIQKAKVEKLAGELEEANQTKARLFSVISHDLRSPVSSLYALLKMQELKAGTGTGSTAVSSQMMHLLDTLEDLLIWSKSQMDKFKLQPVMIPVNALFDEMINLYRDTAISKHIQISNTAVKHIKVYTDENLLKTILRNILSNAVHYAPECSTVMLDAVAQDTQIICTISNDAAASDYEVLENKLNNTAVESGKHGLGTVLVNEFIHKLDTTLRLSYANGRVSLQFSLPAYLK